MALASARAQLATEQQQLDTLQTARDKLQRRIALLRAGDPDILQEVRRKQLLGAENGEVLVPRKP